MATRRSRSNSQYNAEEGVDSQQIDAIEQEKEVEPQLSDDLIVFQAVEKAKEIKQAEEPKPTGNGIISDRQINSLKKFNERIVNKLGLGGTRSYKV